MKMARGAVSRGRRSRARLFLILLFLAAGALFLARRPLLVALGEALVVDEAREPADVILVLGGSLPAAGPAGAQIVKVRLGTATPGGGFPVYGAAFVEGVRRFDPALVDEYNRLVHFEFERARDFIVLHYKATARDDTPFWRRCREMAIPDTLAQKMEIFRAGARIHREHEELFTEDSWTQVLIGQDVMPAAYHPMVDVLAPEQIRQMVAGVRGVLHRAADAMPTHKDYIARNCKAEPVSFG